MSVTGGEIFFLPRDVETPRVYEHNRALVVKETDWSHLVAPLKFKSMEQVLD